MGLSARALLEKLHSQDYGTSDIYISGMMMIDDKALFKWQDEGTWFKLQVK